MWEVEELLQLIKHEVVARELSDTIRVNERNPQPPQQRRPSVPTASFLIANDHSEGKKLIVSFLRKNITQLLVKGWQAWLPTRMPF